MDDNDTWCVHKTDAFQEWNWTRSSLELAHESIAKDGEPLRSESPTLSVRSTRELPCSQQPQHILRPNMVGNIDVLEILVTTYKAGLIPARGVNT